MSDIFEKSSKTIPGYKEYLLHTKGYHLNLEEMIDANCFECNSGYIGQTIAERDCQNTQCIFYSRNPMAKTKIEKKHDRPENILDLLKDPT